MRLSPSHQLEDQPSRRQDEEHPNRPSRRAGDGDDDGGDGGGDASEVPAPHRHRLLYVAAAAPLSCSRSCPCWRPSA